MSTLIQAIRALEAIATAQPAVETVVPNDVFQLNTIPDARYGVFAWTQREHREDPSTGFLTVSLALFYIDRLTADGANRLEVQSAGIQVLGNILRVAEEHGLFVSGEIRYNTFNQRFLDECAGVWASVDLLVPLDWVCPDDWQLPEPVFKYVQDLLDEGFAELLTGPGGNYVQILPTCPYTMEQVLDLEVVARNEKQLTEDVNNIIAWDKELPAGWTQQAVAAIYGIAPGCTPRGGMFWALGSEVSEFEISFEGVQWGATDMPWGSYQSEGIFAPRYNASKEAEYEALGFRNTPEKVTVNLENYSSIGQVMFTQMRTTKELTINIVEGQYFGCHDVVGMFEADEALETLNIIGDFIWETIRTCLYMFDGCLKLTAIPYNTSFSRYHPYNELFPRFDGTRGTANIARIFNNCHELASIGPVLNFSAVSRVAGRTWDGYAQDPTDTTIFDCPKLTDVLIKRLGNCDWNFADHSTGTYLPLISADSINYLLENIQDVSGLGGCSLTLPSLNRSQVLSGYIEMARGKGWTIVFAD